MAANILTSLFSGGVGALVDSVGGVLDKVITTKEEKMGLENELKKADLQFQVDMKKLSIEEQQMVFQDVDSARKREAAVQTSENATTLAKNVSPLIALGTIVLTFALFGTVIFIPNVINPDVKDVVVYVLGVLSAILSQVYSFYFGSSKGSQDKNKLMQGMQDAANK